MRTPRSCLSHVLEKGLYWQHIIFQQTWLGTYTWGQAPDLSDGKEGILAFTGLHLGGGDRPISQVISTASSKGCGSLWEALSSKAGVTLEKFLKTSSLKNLDFIAGITISCNFLLKCDMYRKMPIAKRYSPMDFSQTEHIQVTSFQIKKQQPPGPPSHYSPPWG